MRKRIFSIINLILLPFLLYSQTDKFNKGDMMTGGLISAQFLSTSADNLDSQRDYFKFDFSPYLGYFVLNKLPIGIDFTYQISQNKYDDNTLPDLQNTFLLNPFFRYYLYEGLFMFSKIGFGIGYVKEYDILADEGYYRYKLKYNNFNIGAGYSIFINENIAIDLIAKYYSMQSDSKIYFIDKDKSSGFNISIGFQIFIKNEKNKK